MAPRNLLVMALLGVPLVAAAQLNADAAPEPVAPKKEVVREWHGDRFVDPYFWLREKTNPDVISHLNAENDYAKAVMAPLKPLADKLYKEMVGRIQETDQAVPTFERGYWYYSRTVKGQQYPIVARRKGSMKAKEEILLDLNAMAKGKPFFSLGSWEISANNQILAYSTDVTGYREYQLHFKDLKTGKTLPDRFGKVASFTWANDNKTILYVTENAAKRSDKVWRRQLGSTVARQIFSEPVGQFNVYLSSSKDRKYIFVGTESAEQSEVRFLRRDRPTDGLTLVARRSGEHKYYVDHHDNRFYIRTNLNAKEFRVVTTPVSQFTVNHWRTWIPQQKDATISDVELFDRFAVVSMRRQSVPVMKVIDLRSRRTHEIDFPEANYVAFLSGNPDVEATKVRLIYSSMITPMTTFEYDLRSRRFTVLKRDVVKGYDPKQYTTEFRWATARDGTKVPISIAYRKSTKKGPNTPLFLEAYGSYGSPSMPFFSSNDVSLLDRGFILATAHIRGGGELGEKWHDGGKMAKKMNTFTDFIDCADWLVKNGYSSPKRMGMSGGSAGGLLMGAVMNLRPDLVRAATVYVPFVDVINTMLDETLPLTTQEFIEWGNPKIAEQYGWMRAYSPYDNVGALNYPATLVRTSLNDSQVPYWEAAKWVAMLRDKRANKEPLLLLTNMDAGHGGASGRYDALKDRATDMAFVITMLRG